MFGIYSFIVVVVYSDADHSHGDFTTHSPTDLLMPLHTLLLLTVILLIDPVPTFTYLTLDDYIPHLSVTVH